MKRVVEVSFWSDDKVVDLFSPEDRLFMLYLLTNPHSLPTGIYPLNKKNAAFEIGWSVDTVVTLIDRFERKYDLIRYSEETKEIAIKNYMRHSISNGGKPVEDMLQKYLKCVKDEDLILWVFDSISGDENLPAVVRKTITEYLSNTDNSIRDRDSNRYRYSNRYRESYPVSGYDTGDDTWYVSSDGEDLKPKKPVRHKYGRYENVLLTDEQYAKAKAEIPNLDKLIEEMSEYIASTGKRYKDYLAALRTWYRRRKDNEQQKQRRDGGQYYTAADYADEKPF